MTPLNLILSKDFKNSNYKVGAVAVGPKGRPITKKPITIINHTTENIKTVGLSSFNVPNTVILLLSLLLYFSKKASITIKYTKNGVIPFPTLSAALKINCVKSGVILAFINNGTNTGDISVHFVMASGIRNDIIITTRNIVIINGIPVNSKLLIKLINQEATTVPKFVQFSILTSNDAKNIKINMYPRLSNSFDNPTLKSFVFLMFLDINP